MGEDKNPAKLSAVVKGWLARLTGGRSPDSAPDSALVAPPPDPAKILFPATGAAPERMISGDLGERLERAADDITKRQALLRDSAIDLQRVSAARDRGERQLTIWGFRFLIGAAWLGLAGWLNQSALQARANDLPLANAMPVDDAMVLAHTFFLAGASALGAALIMIALIFISGNGGNDRLRRRGEIFGDALAATAREFNNALKYFRDKISTGDKAAADIVPAVSQAHLTALEAKVFFRDISFLTMIDADGADVAFRGFLRRFCPSIGGFAFFDVLLGMMLGAIAGLGAGWTLFKPAVEAAAGPVGLAITQYPLALQTLLLGGGLYIVTGVVVELMSGLFTNGEMTKARKAALDSVRSAYIAQEAPLSSEVIRQVEDVVEILRARLGAGSGGRNSLSPSEVAAQSPAYALKSQAAVSQFDDPDLDMPAWRRRDSSVQFVETGFQAAPKEWRIEPYTDFSNRGTAPKRGFFGLKKPRGD